MPPLFFRLLLRFPCRTFQPCRAQCKAQAKCLDFSLLFGYNMSLCDRRFFMTDVILYLGTCLVGYFCGRPLKKYEDKLGWSGKVQSLSLIVLIFTLGLRIGANEEVVHSLHSYGVYAFFFTVLADAGSIGALFLVRKYFLRMNRYGEPVGSTASSGQEAAGEGSSSAKTSGDRRGPLINKTTVMIVVFVILGILTGYFFARERITDFDAFSSACSMVITVGLVILLFLIGLDIGLEGKLVENFKLVGLKVLAVPAAVFFGTFAGSVVSFLFLPKLLGIPLTLMENFSIGAGFAWYSLAPGVILDAGHISAGAISFMHNVMREVFGVVLIPVIANTVGYVECIAPPASPAMDVCLPVVEASTNGTVAIYSFISGFTLSFIVPLLVPLLV